MPKAETVSVKIAPIEARMVAEWLRSLPSPLFDGPRLNVRTLPNGVRESFVEQLEGFAKRKRRSGAFLAAGIELSRLDAQFLAAKAQPGMFGTARQRQIPAVVHALCRQCLAALNKKRGAPKQRAAALENAISRQGRNTTDPVRPVDPRWLKRLKKRQREDTEMAEWLGKGRGLWGALPLRQNSL
jgi:hypothetical protein